MANTIPVAIDLFPPHEKAPDWVKGKGRMLISDEDFRLIEEYKRAYSGEKDANFIPIQVTVTKNTGMNMLSIDSDTIKYLNNKKAGSSKVSLEEDIDMDSIPF